MTGNVQLLENGKWYWVRVQRGSRFQPAIYNSGDKCFSIRGYNHAAQSCDVLPMLPPEQSSKLLEQEQRLNRQKVLLDIGQETERAYEKWGSYLDRQYRLVDMLAIQTEEYLELVRAINDGKPLSEVRGEALQLASCCQMMIEAIDAIEVVRETLDELSKPEGIDADPT